MRHQDPQAPHRSYFPDRLLERRRRAEAALVTVVATPYLLGVSTRRLALLYNKRPSRRAAQQ